MTRNTPDAEEKSSTLSVELWPCVGPFNPPLIDTTNAYMGYFQNIHGEQIVFRLKDGETVPTLWHSDMGWEQFSVAWRPALDISIRDTMVHIPAGLTITDPAGRQSSLSSEEMEWALACWKATQWKRNRAPQTAKQP